MTTPFEPRRFRTSAPHYVRGRLEYPPDLIRRVAQLVGLGPTHRLLDLGCGPGFLAVAFAPHVREAVGIDPEPAMLEVAAEFAQSRNAKITLRRGSSFELEPDLGPFRLAAMGRSFHWMDRPATLAALKPMIEAGGAVALFSDTPVKVAENAWQKPFWEVLDPYAERDPANPRARWRDPAWRSHEGVLLDSAFSRLERISVIHRLVTPVERLLDRALSLSVTSPERLGADRERVIARLRQALAEAVPSGEATEVVEFEALLGFLV